MNKQVVSKADQAAGVGWQKICREASSVALVICGVNGGVANRPAAIQRYLQGLCDALGADAGLLYGIGVHGYGQLATVSTLVNSTYPIFKKPLFITEIGWTSNSTTCPAELGHPIFTVTEVFPGGGQYLVCAARLQRNVRLADDRAGKEACLGPSGVKRLARKRAMSA